MATDETIVNREIKLGLALLAVLTVALGYVIAKRIFHTEEAPPAVLSSPIKDLLPQEKSNSQPTVLPPRNRYSGPAEFANPSSSTLLPPRSFDEQSTEAVESHAQPPAILPYSNTSEPDKVRTALVPVSPGTEVKMPLANPAIEKAPTVSPPAVKPFEGSMHTPLPGVGVPVGPADSEKTPVNFSGYEAERENILRISASSPAPEKVKTPSSTRQPKARVVNAGEPEILPSNYESLVKGKRYQIQKTDTLESIAEKQLGSKARWPEIYYLNRDKFGSSSPKIQAGDWLIMPAGKKRTATATNSYGSAPK